MLLPELARDGHQVAVAVRGPRYDLQPDLEAAGVSVIRLPPRAKWNLLGAARDISRAMPEADVIHAHLYFPAVACALARILDFTSAKTFVTYHNLAYAGANRDGFKLHFRKAFACWVTARGVDHKLAVSQAVADHYQAALKLDRVDVLHNPIDLAAIDAVSHPAPTDGAPIQIVLPGRLVAEKGHQYLITALHDPRLAKMPIQIIFAGHGPLHRALEDCASALPFPVTITGALKHRDFMAVVASADIVVVPSRFEGFGLTALEAMGLSKPVIASRAGGLPEVLGDTGRLVPVGGVTALADALVELSQDETLRNDLGCAARTRAKAEFGLSNIAARLVNIYRTSLTPQEV